MTTSSLVDSQGQLLPVWQFLAFHDALRRDAARFRAALPTFTDETESRSERVVAFRLHWESYRALLEWHHEVEDNQLFPFMRERDPDEVRSQYPAWRRAYERSLATWT